MLQLKTQFISKGNIMRADGGGEYLEMFNNGNALI